MLAELIGRIKAPDDRTQPGEKCHRRPLTIQTLLGPLTVTRRYYYHPGKPRHCRGRCPLSRTLGLFGHATPGLAKIATRAAAQSSYQEASADLKELAGIDLCARQLQRLSQDVGANLRETLRRLPPKPICAPIPILYIEVDGTGVPMIKAALEAAKSRDADGGPAKTREVKTACLFTQTRPDDQGRPQRDEGSTTWVAGFESAGDFGPRLRDEAQRRGSHCAERIVLLGDGAAWIWEMARHYFPTATCILDFWHASEYLGEMTKLAHPGDATAAQNLYHQWKTDLAQSRLDSILTAARDHRDRIAAATPAAAEAMEKKIAYLENNRRRMDYASYRKDGLFVGSGIVEAGCKKVIGQRFKASGMFWSEPGARNLLHIRTALLSQDRFNDFWNARAAA